MKNAVFFESAPFSVFLSILATPEKAPKASKWVGWVIGWLVWFLGLVGWLGWLFGSFGCFGWLVDLVGCLPRP